jgi:HEAT repeat protein
MFSIHHDSDHRWADALASRDGTHRAALVMKDLAHPYTVDTLLEALDDENGDVRWVAAEALGAIGTPAVEPLLHVLIQKGDSFELRDAAHVTISLLDDEEIRTLLLPVYRALVDRSPPDVVMAEAGLALVALNRAGALLP